MKVVINTCFGGFSLSEAAIQRFCELDGCSPTDFWSGIVERNDPNLVKVVQELGVDAETSCSELKIVEIPDGVKWHIHEYDGVEHVAEDHRTWYGDEVSP
jgi:hypothetical protein